MSGRIIIAGATGSVGSMLIPFLQELGYEVISLTRSPASSRSSLPTVSQHIALTQQASDELLRTLDGSAGMINLAGASIGSLRWTAANKKLIKQSRVQTTQMLSDATHRVATPPQFFLSSSAVGIYGNGHDRELTEDSEAGTDFLSEVCQAWEQAARDVHPSTRLIIPRIGVVMDTASGALAELLPAFRFFIGGPLGSGQQWFPWIHRRDLTRALVFMIENPALNGVYNCVAPNAIRMNELARVLGTTMHRPSLLRVPEWSLRLLLGEKHVIVTQGQHVIPRRLIDAGFEFEFESITECVNNLLL